MLQGEDGGLVFNTGKEKSHQEVHYSYLGVTVVQKINTICPTAVHSQLSQYGVEYKLRFRLTTLEDGSVKSTLFL